MPTYKVLAEEIDTIELAFPTEILMSGANSVFAPTTATATVPALTATNVQAAITQAQAQNNTTFITSITSVSTTGTAFLVDTPFSITPPAGTWVIWFTGDVETTGVNAQGDLQMFVDGVAIVESLRSLQNTVTVATMSLSAANVQSTLAFVQRITFSGAQAVTVRYRVSPTTSGAGSIKLNGRTMLLMQVGL